MNIIKCYSQLPPMNYMNKLSAVTYKSNEFAREGGWVYSSYKTNKTRFNRGTCNRTEIIELLISFNT